MTLTYQPDPAALRIARVGLASVNAVAERTARSKASVYERFAVPRGVDLHALAVVASEGPIGPATLAVALWPEARCDGPARVALARLRARGLVTVEREAPAGKYLANGGRKYLATEQGRASLREATEAGARR